MSKHKKYNKKDDNKQDGKVSQKITHRLFKKPVVEASTVKENKMKWGYPIQVAIAGMSPFFNCPANVNFQAPNNLGRANLASAHVANQRMFGPLDNTLDFIATAVESECRRKRRKRVVAAGSNVNPFSSFSMPRRAKQCCELIVNHIHARTIPNDLNDMDGVKKMNIIQQTNAFTKNLFAYICYICAKGPNPVIEVNCVSLEQMRGKYPEQFRMACEMRDWILVHYSKLDANRGDYYLSLTPADINEVDLSNFLDDMVKKIQSIWSLKYNFDRCVRNRKVKSKHVKGMFYPNALIMATLSKRCRNKLRAADQMIPRNGYHITPEEAQLLVNHPTMFANDPDSDASGDITDGETGPPVVPVPPPNAAADTSAGNPAAGNPAATGNSAPATGGGANA